MPRRASPPPVAEPPAAPAGAREQLLRAATAAFAAKGYAAASTREICEAAGVNIAAIAYYFGGKEGLYREALRRPIVEFTGAFGRFDDPALTFAQSMRMFLAPFLGAATAGGGLDAALEADVRKLHLREMLEPSAAFREIVAQVIAPAHRALCRLLARHCGLAQADDDIQQLAFAIAALANDYCTSREFMKLLAPGVLERARAQEQILDRLVGFAAALLHFEVARRRRPALAANARRGTAPRRGPDPQPAPQRGSPSAPGETAPARAGPKQATRHAEARSNSAPRNARR